MRFAAHARASVIVTRIAAKASEIRSKREEHEAMHETYSYHIDPEALRAAHESVQSHHDEMWMGDASAAAAAAASHIAAGAGAGAGGGGAAGEAEIDPLVDAMNSIASAQSSGDLNTVASAAAAGSSGSAAGSRSPPPLTLARKGSMDARLQQQAAMRAARVRTTSPPPAQAEAASGGNATERTSLLPPGTSPA